MDKSSNGKKKVTIVPLCPRKPECKGFLVQGGKEGVTTAEKERGVGPWGKSCLLYKKVRLFGCLSWGSWQCPRGRGGSSGRLAGEVHGKKNRFCIRFSKMASKSTRGGVLQKTPRGKAPTRRLVF